MQHNRTGKVRRLFRLACSQYLLHRDRTDSNNESIDSCCSESNLRINGLERGSETFKDSSITGGDTYGDRLHQYSAVARQRI